MPKKRVRPPGTTGTSRVLILLEHIERNVEAMAEGQVSLEQRLTKRIDDLRTDLTRRIEAMESAIRQNSEVLAKHSETLAKHSETLAKHSETLAKHSEEIRLMRQLLDRKVDQESLQRLERRVTALEQRVGIIS